MSKELEIQVAEVVLKAVQRTTPSADWWQAKAFSAEVVSRLLAGGISETAIRNTLVHHRETPEPRVKPDGTWHDEFCNCEDCR